MSNNQKDWQNYLKTDFSKEDTQKEKTRQILLSQISEDEHMEKKIVKKPRKYLTSILVAAISICLFSGVAYATVRYFNLGHHATFVMQDEDENAKREAMMVWDGQLYDAQGQKIDIKTLDFDTIPEQKFYNQNGARVVFDYDDEVGKFVLINYDDFLAEQESDNGLSMHCATLDEVKPYLAFDFVFPSYIPENYKTNDFVIFKDEDGSVGKNQKYLTIVYNNEKNPIEEFAIDLRLMDEETAFTMGTKGLTQTVINGHEAVYNDHSVSIIINDVMYTVARSTDGNESRITYDEMMKIATSIQ